MHFSIFRENLESSTTANVHVVSSSDELQFTTALADAQASWDISRAEDAWWKGSNQWVKLVHLLHFSALSTEYLINPIIAHTKLYLFTAIRQYIRNSLLEATIFNLIPETGYCDMFDVTHRSTCRIVNCAFLTAITLKFPWVALFRDLAKAFHAYEQTFVSCHLNERSWRLRTQKNSLSCTGLLSTGSHPTMAWNGLLLGRWSNTSLRLFRFFSSCSFPNGDCVTAAF